MDQRQKRAPLTGVVDPAPSRPPRTPAEVFAPFPDDLAAGYKQRLRDDQCWNCGKPLAATRSVYRKCARCGRHFKFGENVATELTPCPPDMAGHDVVTQRIVVVLQNRTRIMYGEGIHRLPKNARYFEREFEL